MVKGVKFEPGKIYIGVGDTIYTVDKKTGKFGWMDTIKFVATQSLRTPRRSREDKVKIPKLDISEYLPDEYKEAAKQWYEL